MQHYRLFVERRARSFFSDFEVRAYLLIAFAAVAAHRPDPAAGSTATTRSRAIRGAAFQVSSIVTTTGFGTEDFELWYPLAQ